MYARLLLLTVLCFSFALNAYPLRFAVYEPGFPPFIFIDDQQKDITGIVPELLTAFSQQQQITIEYVMDNRKGGEQRLYEGNVDAMLISPQWAKHADQLVFSNAILPYDDYLFHLASAAPKALSGGRSVCTRQYYVYPTLEPHFAAGTLLRIDASSQHAQLKMLANARCDYAYLNELVAHWLVARYFPDLQLTSISDFKASTSLQIALHPNWRKHLPALNQFIGEKQKSGELKAIVEGFVFMESEQ
ncbi:transporter substrate-binding domain-containing protein [Lacimicrobium sp. SS2-24]|uniref:substrate-binding periplasmic protein n=1 Tax=Lacimicrobium sp. SS2-24 TaxID=2005569 RepID=UPI000B4ABF3B|nr:transporter substrate-binding domain-containing protein [Lacimicrobium sp. SS2-24]